MPHLPHLILHAAASLDGRLTLAPDVLLLYGDPRWEEAGGPAGDAVYGELMRRFQPQAILEGSGSLVLESETLQSLPPLDKEDAGLLEDFMPAELAGKKWFSVVDGRGRIRWMYKEFPGEMWAGWHALVLVCAATPPAYLATLRRERIPYLVAGEGRVDLRQAMEKMQSSLGVERVVATCGGRLGGALLRASLVNEISLEFFPALIGGKDTPALLDGEPLRPDEKPARLHLISHEITPAGGLKLHYTLEATPV